MGSSFHFTVSSPMGVFKDCLIFWATPGALYRQNLRAFVADVPFILGKARGREIQFLNTF